MIVFDADDYGCNHVISDMCQSHDCRDKLDEFHYVNPNFKATLFAIPSQMTYELLEWCEANRQWIELAVHGFTHSSNYECEKMTLEEFAGNMEKYKDMFDSFFVKGFKAPGWQISDDCYTWLKDHGWWVADQGYNNNRRPLTAELPVYIIGEDKRIKSMHHHTWDCVGNGVYEMSDQIKERIKDETEFKFISEVLNV